jgi:dUTP pyrophosphatase
MNNNGQYGRWFVPYAERVAQLVVCPVTRPAILEVEDLDDTQRGESGYGSTGTK